MKTLSPNTLMILGILLAIIIVVSVVIAVRTYRKAKQRGEEAVGEMNPADLAAMDAAADAATSAELSRGFLAAARNLRERAPSRSQRHNIPWYLALGAANSGKSTALAGVRLPLPFGAPDERDTDDKRGASWWLFDRAVVIDVAGDYVLRDDELPADDRGWRTLLRLLRRERPERPIDGVVLTIPATELVGDDRLARETLFARAAATAERLWDLQRTLGVRFPVYVLITKCDTLRGFKAYTGALPAHLQQDMFGWSVPYALDTPFGLGWVDEGFGMVRSQLNQSVGEILTQPFIPPDSEELYLFPGEFEELLDPLRDYVAKLFRQTVYDAGFSFRGFYFTGDAWTAGSSAALAATNPASPDSITLEVDAPTLPFASINPAVTGSGASVARQPAFLQAFFRDKVFAEFGLAEPVSRTLLSSNRRVFAAQLATAALVLIGTLGLWTTYVGVRVGPWTLTRGLAEEARSMKELLAGISIDLEEMQRPPSTNAADRARTGQRREKEVLTLVSDLAEASRGRLWSFWIPATWVSPLHDGIRDAVRLGFQKVVMPDVRQRLVERIDRLTGRRGTPPALIATGGPLRESDVQPMRLYLRELVLLGDQVDKYNGLSDSNRRDLKDLSVLFEYLYGQGLATNLLIHERYFLDALKSANAPRIEPSATFSDAALGYGGFLLRRTHGALVRRLATELDTVAGTTRSSAEDIEPLRDLRKFLDLSDPKLGVMAAMPDSFFFGGRFARQVQDSVLWYTEDLTGALLPRGADPGAALSSVKVGLDSLLRQRFMEPGPARPLSAELRPGTRLTWDAARLDFALALHANYAKFATATFDSFPPTLREWVQGAAAAQVAARMADAVASAQVFQAVPATLNKQGLERELRLQTTNFTAAAPRLSQLIERFEELGARDVAGGLSDVSAADAGFLLASVQQLFNATQPYQPQQSALSSWEGGTPVAFAAFGVSEAQELDEYLEQQRLQLTQLAELAKPAASFLGRPGAVLPALPPALLPTWTGIVDAVDKYAAKAPGSTISGLEKFVREDMSATDFRACAKSAGGDTRSSSGDFFVQRRASLRRALVARCSEVSGRRALAAYQRIQDTFNQRLAGRFPFVDPAQAADAPDAEPEAIRSFFKQFDAFMKQWSEAVDGDPRFGSTGRPARAFLDEMASVRTFFGPFVDSAVTRRLPAYDLQVEFRTLRRAESEANQVAEWSLQAGARTIALGDTAKGTRWSFGDPVTLTLRWATGSRFAPVTDATVGAEARDDRSVRFREDGPWSLVSFLSRFADQEGDVEGRHTLGFSVPTAQPGGPGQAPLRGPEARVHIRIRLFHPDTKVELVLPDFPRAMPGLEFARGGL